MDKISTDIEIGRLDHLGIVAGTIRDLGIVDMIDNHIKPGKQQIITTGEATAGMILNGLGFCSEALYLSPNFFKDKALDVLFDKENIAPENFNARKLGDSLDLLYQHGLKNLFMEISLSCCAKEKINTNFQSLDTTSISLFGEYDADNDEQAIRITHGFSKDKRPDLKQVIHELLVSQDGGIPLASQTWSGNTADSKIFQDRAKQLVESFGNTSFDNTLVADSKLYNSGNSKNLQKINFITRIPNSIKETEEKIQKAVNLEKNKWIKTDEKNKYMTFELNHYNIKQRWIIVNSDAAKSRAEKGIIKKISKEVESFNSEIKTINKNKLSCSKDLHKMLGNSLEKIKFHAIDYDIKKSTDKEGGEFYEISVTNVCLDKTAKENYIKSKSCYVIGTNISKEELCDKGVIEKYKLQNSSIENIGFRFLKDPVFFTSSLFVKLPQRIEALLFVMTLSLLVYSIAQRRIRKALSKDNKSVPNQLNKPTQNPTLKWVFKLLVGINFVKQKINGIVQRFYAGIDKLKKEIICSFGGNARKIYGFQT